MAKEAKTNAMRMLERAKVAYTAHEYPHEEGQAVDGAKQTAARLGLDADRADFRCQDAGAAAAQLAAEGARPDVIVVDPPRKGCDEAALTAIAEMAPRTVVMVSCNAATAARDTKWLTEHGYKAVEVQPVDLFPRTRHVECVVLLSKV